MHTQHVIVFSPNKMYKLCKELARMHLNATLLKILILLHLYRTKKDIYNLANPTRSLDIIANTLKSVYLIISPTKEPTNHTNKVENTYWS